jgi:hypothetical protein
VHREPLVLVHRELKVHKEQREPKVYKVHREYKVPRLPYLTVAGFQ